MKNTIKKRKSKIFCIFILFVLTFNIQQSLAQFEVNVEVNEIPKPVVEDDVNYSGGGIATYRLEIDIQNITNDILAINLLGWELSYDSCRVGGGCRHKIIFLKKRENVMRFSSECSDDSTVFYEHRYKGKPQIKIIQPNEHFKLVFEFSFGFLGHYVEYDAIDLGIYYLTLEMLRNAPVQSYDLVTANCYVVGDMTKRRKFLRIGRANPGANKVVVFNNECKEKKRCADFEKVFVKSLHFRKEIDGLFIDLSAAKIKEE